MFLSHLFQSSYVLKFSIKSRFEGNSYKIIKNLAILITPISNRNFSSGCIYRPAFWIQLWLTDFSALLCWFGSTGNSVHTSKVSPLYVRLKICLWPGYQNSKGNVFYIIQGETWCIWLPVVAEEFHDNAKRKLSISLASEVMLRKSSALVSSFVSWLISSIFNKIEMWASLPKAECPLYTYITHIRFRGVGTSP